MRDMPFWTIVMRSLREGNWIGGGLSQVKAKAKPNDLQEGRSGVCRRRVCWILLPEVRPAGGLLSRPKIDWRQQGLLTFGGAERGFFFCSQHQYRELSVIYARLGSIFRSNVRKVVECLLRNFWGAFVRKVFSPK